MIRGGRGSFMESTSRPFGYDLSQYENLLAYTCAPVVAESVVLTKFPVWSSEGPTGHPPEMTSSPVEPTVSISSQILVVRGHRVILDAALAELYGVTTRRLNEQVAGINGDFRTISCSS